jgi:uncharacterized membrane protein
VAGLLSFIVRRRRASVPTRVGRVLGFILGLLILGAITALVCVARREGSVTFIVVGLLIFAAKVALVFVISLFVPPD